MRLFNIFKNLAKRSKQTVYFCEEDCATGLANIVAFAKSHRMGSRPFAFNVSNAVAGSVTDTYFGNSWCIVYARFTSDNYGVLLCMSDNYATPIAVAWVYNATTYGWFSPLHPVYESTAITTSVASGTTTNIRSLSLPAGNYYVMGHAQWTESFNYYTNLSIIGWTYQPTVRTTAVNGGGAYVGMYANLTSATTLYLNVWQNSGSTRTATNIQFTAIKIG